MRLLYSTQATALGGRSGSVCSIDGRLRAELSSPEAMGGNGGSGTNPEQLLAAAYASSFLCAVREAGTRAGHSIPPDANVTARVDLTEHEGASWQLSVSLTLDLPEHGNDRFDSIVSEARRICPLVSATNSTISVGVQRI
ncbi:Ohr family peroxiredoxin [Qipengyuania sp. GH25]|uniref:Ohr family peroxiredoxin n=1 Tax=Qipengyuania pacifica TaxID=2860199 RepID=A0ABS7JK90_9SPHN|nr:Ohr family peroxiredoxin [Qipengyuania aerophila]MBX7489812.1 Ohr family peroxiredoxin [Qipengyuania aerophila]